MKCFYRFDMALANALNYLTEAALEIFSPNHDSYPATGIQPFYGEIYRPEGQVA